MNQNRGLRKIMSLNLGPMKTLVTALLVLVSLCVFNAPSLDAQVVCFGDSITKRGYPEILGQLLGVETINAGVAGNNTSQALRRTQLDVFIHNPEVVVIFFGTNDLRVDSERVYVAVPQYITNLETIIAECQSQGARVVLCTPPPIDDDAFYTRHERADFEAIGGLQAMLDLLL